MSKRVDFQVDFPLPVRFTVDGKNLEHGTFQKRCQDNHVISLTADR